MNDEQNTGMKVLAGLRVVEMGTFITGPAAGMLLGDLGADVIKVEQPGTGDPFRAFKGGLYSTHFQAYNRNKRSIALDTTQPADLETFDRLIATADVFIHNFRPGVEAKLKVDRARLQAINPRLIHCAITGFGSSGPASQRPSYDTVAQAASGFLDLMMNPTHRRITGPAIADAMTGFYAAYGVLGALHERARTGLGRAVEVSMLAAMTHFNIDAFTQYFGSGEAPDAFSRARASQSYALECADGKWIALHMSSPEKFWQGLATAIEKQDLLHDPRFRSREGRVTHQDAMLDELQAIFRTRSRADWCGRLESQDVPFAPVYDVREALQDEQARHMRLQVELDHPTMGRFRTVRSPVLYDGHPVPVGKAPPTLDEHGRDIIGELPSRSQD